MREKLQKLMLGRYGNDRLNQILLFLGMVCLIFSLFGWGFFYFLATCALAYAYFRMFSKNVDGRLAENQWFLKQEMKLRQLVSKKKKD